jgi:hypothetical protein
MTDIRARMLETLGSQISEDDRLDVADMLTDGELPEVKPEPPAPAGENADAAPKAEADAPTDVPATAEVKTEPETAATIESDTQTPRVVMPQIEVGDVTEHKKAYDEAQAEIKKVRELRKAGEISSDEADEQIDALIDKRDQAREKVSQYEMQVAINEAGKAAERQAVWDVALNALTEKHPHYKSKPAFEALTVAVNEAAAKFASEGVEKTPAQILRSAHEEVQKLFGVPASVPAPAPATKAAPPAPIKNPEIPISIASMPPSGQSEATDEFAYLDNLAPQDLINRMGVMRKKDPESYDRYMSRA